MTEAFLQYVWQHQLLDDGLTTTDGQSVTVVRAGSPNNDAGPDFTNATIRIGDIQWVGNVEVHIKSSDWNRHHHTSDPAYGNVVLHVVYEHDGEVIAVNGNAPATLELRRFLPEYLWNNYELLVDPPQPMEIPCAEYLGDITQMQRNQLLDRLATERLQQKTDLVKRLLSESKGNWEECCYWLMAHYFGAKINAFPFELLAKATPMRLLARWKDNPERVEALLMGQAGLLEGYFEEEYPRQLQADYEALKAGAGLTPIAGYLWKFFRLRPTSFPTIRISQFAQLIASSSNLFSKLLETPKAEDLVGFFDVKTSAYWKNHYRFDTPSAEREKHLGRSLIEVILINAWVPLLFEYGVQHGQENYQEQAIDILHQLGAEKNHIIQHWTQVGITPTDAAESQALLQLHNEYCTRRRCLQCPWGYQIITRHDESQRVEHPSDCC